MAGIQSRIVSDALITRQLYVERLKTTLHGERATVSDAVLSALLLETGRFTVARLGMLTKAGLRKLIASVLEKYDLEANKHAEQLSTLLQDYAEAEGDFYTDLLNGSLDEDDVSSSPVWPFVAGAIIAATGETISKTIQTMNRTQRNTLIKTIQRAYAQNWTPSQLVSAVRGTAFANFKDGLAARLANSTAAIVDTTVQAAMSAARVRVIGRFSDFILGYTWVSVLDSRTSATCRSLSGRVFEYGAGPIPPIHYRCRSHVEPLFRRSATLRQGVASAVAIGETYYDWLSRQPKSLQDEVLGPTRGSIFRRGKLSAAQFAKVSLNSRFEPLTLDELRRKSSAFAN